MPSAPPFASVIVVCWNAADVLGRCLDALLAQDYPNYEIVVVDDGSQDDSVEEAAKHVADERVTVVSGILNRGCPSARNLGLRHARGEIVAFVDADGFATPDWLSEIVREFDDPEVGGVASTVFFDRNPLVLNGCGGWMDRQGWAADIGYQQPFQNATLDREVLYPMGCGMAVRRETVERVGPFDDRFLNYYDDADYGLRIWRAGWKVVAAGRAWVDHGFGQSAGSDSPRKQLLCEQHRMAVMLKHLPLRRLPGWLWREARALLAAPSPRHEIKREAIGWNARHLPSTLAERWRHRGRPLPPPHVFDMSRSGDTAPEPPPLNEPDPDSASAAIDMGSPTTDGALLYGWYEYETDVSGPFRWTTGVAAGLLMLDRPASQLRLRYRTPAWGVGPVSMALRRSSEAGAAVWTYRTTEATDLWRTEEHPVALPPGEYVMTFTVEDARPRLPEEGRALGLALSVVEAV